MKNVMLIDDDSICNFLHTKSLERTGLVNEIHTATNGAQAIELINDYFQGTKQLPDVILLDLNMPVMDGFEFLGAFRMLNLRDKDSVKIIIVTSSVDANDRIRASKLGVSQFITKPLSEERLIEALKKLE